MLASTACTLDTKERTNAVVGGTKRLTLVNDTTLNVCTGNTVAEIISWYAL